jgi:hypothetical protein
MGIRVLSSGVDTLHGSMRGTVRPDLWELGQEAQQRAKEGDLEPVELGDRGQAFNVQGHGIRGYGLWMSSRDWELMLTQSEKFPAALAQVHSAYLHSMGVAPAAQLVEQTLRRAVMARAEAFTVFRIDLYADVQGWALDLDHLHRFVSRSRVRRAFPRSPALVCDGASREGSARPGRDGGAGALADQLDDEHVHARVARHAEGGGRPDGRLPPGHCRPGSGGGGRLLIPVCGRGGQPERSDLVGRGRAPLPGCDLLSQGGAPPPTTQPLRLGA